MYKIFVEHLIVGDNTSIWTPLSDVEKENEYRNIQNEEISNFMPWYPGEPTNHGGDEACIVLGNYEGETGFLDFPCQTEWKELKFICAHKTTPVFNLRGSCPRSKLPRHFAPFTRKIWTDVEYIVVDGTGFTIKWDSKIIAWRGKGELSKQTDQNF